jgi:general stress protein YciG
VCASTVSRTLPLSFHLDSAVRRDCRDFLAVQARPRRGTTVAQSCSTVTNEYKGVDVAKEDRGFASMDRSKQKEIASKGGKAAHQKGTAHEWTSEEARDAGRKGGLASHRRRREQKDGSDTREMVGVESGILTSRAVEQAG